MIVSTPDQNNPVGPLPKIFTIEDSYGSAPARDELLTRNGRDYDLTPFAVELLPEVQHALRLISRALHVEEGFDPGTSERTFRLTMSDYAIAVVHDTLLARISELAPGVRLRIDHLGPDIRSSDERHILADEPLNRQLRLQPARVEGRRRRSRPACRVTSRRGCDRRRSMVR